MVIPHTLRCDKCGNVVPTALINSISVAGVSTRWPKSTMRAGQLYLFIDCPTCGQIEQNVLAPGDGPQAVRRSP